MPPEGSTSAHSILHALGRGSAVDRLALLISGLASPFVVLPAFAALLTAHLARDLMSFLWWSAIAIGFSTGIPFLYILVGTWTGSITDLHVMRREQRRGPFIVSLASSSAGSAALHLVGAPLPLVVLGIAIVANGVVFALITLRWKISMHPSVLTASILAGTFLINPGYLWAFGLLPAVIWARTRRTRHNVVQGIAAVAIAVVVTMVVLWAFGFVEFAHA